MLCLHSNADRLGQLISYLLTSKSRVALFRRQSIPRLELCTALLGSQLVDNLLATTNISHVFDQLVYCTSMDKIQIEFLENVCFEPSR